MTLPGILSRAEIHQRLQSIFPVGTPQRNYVTREMSASTIFVAIYVGAIEGNDQQFGPKHVYRMTHEQSALQSEEDRRAYVVSIAKPGRTISGKRWYEDNTRESIRDETLREGLVAIGAVMERTDVPTTSSRPRYALKAPFAALFDPALEGDALVSAIAKWQETYLSAGALARVAVVRTGAMANADLVLVTLPSGVTRQMKAGLSSLLTKAVIEVFAPRFLDQPAVIFMSESGNKVISQDDQLAKLIGLNIQADKNLPDVILVDLRDPHPMLVFVEVVASDGPVSERRKQALSTLVSGAGFPLQHVAFVTAYLDRSSAPFKKTVDSLAWGSYAWFASEPEHLVEFSESATRLG